MFSKIVNKSLLAGFVFLPFIDTACWSHEATEESKKSVEILRHAEMMSRDYGSNTTRSLDLTYLPKDCVSIAYSRETKYFNSHDAGFCGGEVGSTNHIEHTIPETYDLLSHLMDLQMTSPYPQLPIYHNLLGNIINRTKENLSVIHRSPEEDTPMHLINCISAMIKLKGSLELSKQEQTTVQIIFTSASATDTIVADWTQAQIILEALSLSSDFTNAKNCSILAKKYAEAYADSEKS